ncbi:MAG: hypothetical protein FGM29_02505 [Actinobacteria bacterium]|nr:hypothetical protein [Actinomycetota bacterium]
MLEADVDGGVLGARYGLGVEPGVVSFIASLRRSGDAVAVGEHGRMAAPGLWLVPGPESAEQAGSVWSGTAGQVAARLAGDDRVWLVDGGRLSQTKPTIPLAEWSNLTVVVSRSASEDLLQVPRRVAWLQQHASAVGVLVVGKAPYGSRELAEFFGTASVWTAADSDALPDLAGQALTPGRARRSPLWRSAVEISAEIAGAAVASAPAAAVSSSTVGERRFA